MTPLCSKCGSYSILTVFMKQSEINSGGSQDKSPALDFLPAGPQGLEDKQMWERLCLHLKFIHFVNINLVP